MTKVILRKTIGREFSLFTYIRLSIFMRFSFGLFLFSFLIAVSACRDNLVDDEKGDLTDISYAPTTYALVVPEGFGQPFLPEDNPFTQEGIDLGKALFFDPILSVDSTISCSSCHLQAQSFNDPRAFSTGVNGLAGDRSSMSLMNLAFENNGFFWDGRSASLEAQALIPVEHPKEMAANWVDIELKLRNHLVYPTLFRKAFGIKNVTEINRQLVARALAQFERTLISSNSKFDRILAGTEKFSDLELYGYKMYLDEDPDIKDAECGHCHSIPLMTSTQFFNNGLDPAPNLIEFPDLGLGKFTGRQIDNGKFKAPSLRNIMLTAPYMHDGRFADIDAVLDHYSSGGNWAPNKDPLIYPTEFTSLERRALKAFLETLTDTSFVQNAKFQPN